MVSQARVRSLRPERRRPSPAIVLAAAATTAAVGGGLLDAALHRHSEPQEPTPPAPPTANPSPPPVESDLVAATNAKRDDAFTACDEARWALCDRLLDEAKKLDPAGESDPRVLRARAAADRGQHPDKYEPKAARPLK